MIVCFLYFIDYFRIHLSGSDCSKVSSSFPIHSMGGCPQKDFSGNVCFCASFMTLLELS